MRIDEDFRPWWEKLNEIRAGIQNGQKYVHQSDFLIKHSMSMRQYLKNFHIIHRPITIWALQSISRKDFQQAALSFENALKNLPRLSKSNKKP